MIISRDVQSEEAPKPVEIDWVSVSDISVPLGEITFNGVKFAAVPRIKAAVNLPRNLRGIHASRTYEAVKWGVSQVDGSTFHHLTSIIARRLLEQHAYSTEAYVSVRAKFFSADKTPVSMVDSLEHFEVALKSYAKRLDTSLQLRNFVGVRAAGITACPCAKEVVREIYSKVNGGVSDGTPIATHMQRSYASILLESDGITSFLDLLDVLKQSFSSRTMELLKRPDEAALVIEAVESPRFVEDVVRYAAEAVVRKFPYVPDVNVVAIRVKSLESIHQHNLESSLITTLGNLRRQLGDKSVA
ncbi:MAG: GTP cyclohydrolase, FolE2/MptA family [Candidatus Caldarchaeum sp.]|nr:GTP cyclohydrolase, FolE2/MptA family [Candidatus Caldarchaeum sp.]MDW8359049.1 GTP cyclohydrolase, FolE2/MptA family [Candidatus Caldarchaeum sp.]